MLLFKFTMFLILGNDGATDKIRYRHYAQRLSVAVAYPRFVRGAKTTYRLLRQHNLYGIDCPSRHPFATLLGECNKVG